MLSQILQHLNNKGFKPADQIKDFGCVIPYCDYLTREVDGKHQYISVIQYGGKFCEAVWEVYLKTKNTRRPKNLNNRAELDKQGYTPVDVGLLRTVEEVKAKT